MNLKNYFFCVFIVSTLLVCATLMQAQDEPVRRGPYIYTHEPVSSVLENEPIEISVAVGEYVLGDKVFIFFKEPWAVSYNSFPMGYNPNSDAFEFVIDKRFHTKEIIEYYIEIMPKDGQKIRLPAGTGNHYQVKSYSNLMKILKPVFLFILILSPVIAIFLFRRIHSVHVQRTAKYQQKIRMRRRKLGREREKHYKEYVDKMTGSKKPSNRKDKSEKKPKPVAKPSRQPLDVDNIASHEPEPDTTTGELKRELDQILRTQKLDKPSTPTLPSKKRPVQKRTPAASFRTTTKTPPRRPAPSVQPPKKAPPKKAPPQKAPPKKVVKPATTTDPTRPIRTRKSRDNGLHDKPDKTQPTIPDDTTSLGEEERNKLLDILGLDI